jgi:hypothetical protein
MEAIELRIGNYVNLLGNNRQIECISKLPMRNTMYWIKCVDIIDTKIIHFKPIKLDEEWFLKCKSNSIFNNGFEYKKTSTGRFKIYAGMSLITVIEFVHELQNLNFALLGEDIVFDTES